MKKLLFTLLFLLLAVNVAAFDVSIEPFVTVPMDSERIVQSGKGLQINAGGKHLFLYGSYETDPIRFAGQHGIDLNIASFGIGFKHDLLGRDKDLENFLVSEGMQVTPKRHGLNFMFDVGYYKPLNGGETHVFNKSTHAEGIWRYMHQKLAVDKHFVQKKEYMNYMSEYHGGIGGKIGVGYEYKLAKKISLGLGAKYRYLRLKEDLKSWEGERGQNGGWWEMIQERDFSAAEIFLSIKYTF